MHLTDGMIPREALRTFRFNTRRQVEELKQQLDGYTGPLRLYAGNTVRKTFPQTARGEELARMRKSEQTNGCDHRGDLPRDQVLLHAEGRAPGPDAEVA